MESGLFDSMIMAFLQLHFCFPLWTWLEPDISNLLLEDY